MIDAKRHGVDFSRGWHWQSAAFCLWESFTCIAVSFGLLGAAFLSDNAFGVYVFHPPIVIAIARLMHRLAWPPLARFALLAAASALVSFAVSALLLRRLPLLRRIRIRWRSLRWSPRLTRSAAPPPSAPASRSLH